MIILDRAHYEYTHFEVLITWFVFKVELICIIALLMR